MNGFSVPLVYEALGNIMVEVRQFLGSKIGLAVCALAALLGAYLLVFHLTHVALLLPYLILLACPLMHLMHRGHDHGAGKGH